MKKQTKMLMAVLVALAVLAGILGFCIRKSAQEKDGLVIMADGRETVIAWEEIRRESFEGDLVNGKGESSHHVYEGAPLGSIL